MMQALTLGVADRDKTSLCVDADAEGCGDCADTSFTGAEGEASSARDRTCDVWRRRRRRKGAKTMTCVP